jgi:hypothetical protein
MLAVSPYAVEFSQEAALYALASLATTLGLAAGWRWRNSGSSLAAYIILGTVAIYSHYVVAVILALFMLLGLYRRSISSAVSRRGWLLANGSVFLFWSPWLITMLAYWIASPQPRAGLPHTNPLGEEVVGALVQFSSGTSALLQDQELLKTLGLWAGAALFLAGCLLAWIHKRHGIGLVVVISSLVFFLPAVVSDITDRWLFVPHFMLFLLPALLVTLASGATWQTPGEQDPTVRLTGVSLKVRYLLPVLLMPWLIAQIWGLALFYRHPPHGTDGLRELALVLRTSARPGDLVFVTPRPLMPTLRQYYPGEMRGLPVDFDLRAVYLPYDPDDWYRQSVAAFAAEARGRDRLWLVYRPELDKDGKLLQYIMSRYSAVEQHSYEYANLYLLERP